MESPCRTASQQCLQSYIKSDPFSVRGRIRVPREDSRPPFEYESEVSNMQPMRQRCWYRHDRHYDIIHVYRCAFRIAEFLIAIKEGNASLKQSVPHSVPSEESIRGQVTERWRIMGGSFDARQLSHHKVKAHARSDDGAKFNQPTSTNHHLGFEQSIILSFCEKQTSYLRFPTAFHLTRPSILLSILDPPVR